jgi:MarR family transcriptional regulator, temperature-dependent positive regulator of motility
MIMMTVRSTDGDILGPAMATASTSGSMVLLTRLARAVFSLAAEREEVLGMRLKQYALLGDLRDHGGAVSQQALCGTLHLDPNNLVLMLNEIEAAGFAERRRDPDDRRRHIVELTPAGVRALERAEKGMQSVEDEVLSGLNAKERVELGRLLSRALSDEPEAEADSTGAKAQAAAAAGR